MKWYWLDTGWGCGGVAGRAGKVVDGAPIFMRRLRWKMWTPAPQWKVVAL